MMLTVTLCGDFFVEVDEKNFTLKEKYMKKKTDEPAEKIHGYYSTLDGAMRAYFKLCLIKGIEGVVSVQESFEAVRRVCEETIETIKQLSNLLIKEE